MNVVPVSLTAVVSAGGGCGRESGPLTASWQDNVNNKKSIETNDPGRKGITDFFLAGFDNNINYFAGDHNNLKGF